jgi:hypothetical protein
VTSSIIVFSWLFVNDCPGLSSIYDDSRARYFLSTLVSFIDAFGYIRKSYRLTFSLAQFINSPRILLGLPLPLKH